MPTYTLGWSFERGSEVLSGTYSVTDGGELGLSVSLASGSDETLTAVLDVSEIACVDLLGTQDLTIHVNGVNEIQTIAVTPTVSGGSFTLTYSGQTTGAIAWDAAASDVQTALEALSNIDVGDVSVTGGPMPSDDVIIEFRGALAATNVALITVTDSTTGGGSVGCSTTTTGVAADQTIELVANVIWRWIADVSPGSNPLTADWTHLLVSNDSVAPANFYGKILYTP